MRATIQRLFAALVLLLDLSGAGDLWARDLVDAAKRTAQQTERRKGVNSADTARAWQKYGDLLSQQGRAADSIPVVRKVLAIRLAVLGENHPDTAYTLNQLGWALESTDGASAAEPYLRRALAICDRVRGADHPHTILSLQRLGSNLYNQSKYNEAEPYLRRAAETNFRVHGNTSADTAYSMLSFADVLNALKRNIDAAAAYDKALIASESAFGPESLETALVLNNFGFANTQAPTAVPKLQRAAVIREKLLGSHPVTALTLYNLALALFGVGQFDAGAAAADRALSMRQAFLAPDDIRTAWSLNQRAIFHQVKGEVAQAESLANRALAILEKQVGPDDENLGVSIELLAMANEFQAKYSKALELSLKGLATREAAFGGQDPQGLRFLENAARNQEYLGRYSESERSYRRLLEVREKINGPNDADLCGALTGLGDQYSRQGRYQEAELLYRRTLDIRTQAYGPDHFLIPASLSRLSRSLKAQGKYDEAEAHLRRGVAISDKMHGDTIFSTFVREDLADVHELKGNIVEATAIYEGTIALKERTFGKNHPNLALSLGRYASLLWKAGRGDDAEATRARQLSIDIATFGPDHDSTASSYGNLAWLQLYRGRWADALANYEHATDILIRRSMNQLPSPTYAAPSSAESEIGRNPWTLVNHVHAAYWAPRRLPGKTGWDSDIAAAEKTFEIIQWAQLSDTTSALSQMSLRASSKSEQLAAHVRANQDLAAEWGVADAKRSELLAKQSNADEIALAGAARQRLAGIERQLAESNNWLKANFPEYAELSIPRAVSVKEARQLLRSDEALVLFSLTPWDCFVWVVTPEDAQWIRLEISNQTLNAMVTAVRQQLVGGRFNLNVAFGLYQAIFAPIEQQIRGRHLLVVANGALTSLPLHLLVTEKPAASDESLSERFRHASWMIKRHAITMLPSVSALKALRQRSASSDAAEPYLGIGNPLLEGRNGDDRRAWNLKNCSDPAPPAATVLASSSSSPTDGVSSLFRGATADINEVRRLEPLPETVAELCGVADSFGRNHDAVILGSEANEVNIRRLSRDHVLANARIVHFATHGLVAGEIKGMAEPALVLTPPDDDGKSEVSSENDGLLTASDIAQLKFNADWIVLSACNTAAGNATGAEALSGLARAFFYAGTRALLVSHWMVDTEAAVKLMVRTFQIIARDKLIGRAEALRRAMIEIIENGAAAETHPRYWAPFVIVGEGSAR